MSQPYEVIAISGSPSEKSRSTSLLNYYTSALEQLGTRVKHIRLTDLPAKDLILGKYDAPAITAVHDAIAGAKAIILASPVYKATISGGLKALLDVLPENAFAHKTVVPLASAGSSLHLLALDYSLGPILAALGTPKVLKGIYAAQTQLTSKGDSYEPDPDVRARLDHSIKELHHTLAPASALSHPNPDAWINRHFIAV
ncbi:NADPH-dependent FMN reductase [Paenalcaligenes sp. Me131]|uniref:NADPH-dependent FMN reductase n=1 Tax=Paenalcaligenes sp. Me131 TaxID=3392636 RepID=UPI003D2DC7D0